MHFWRAFTSAEKTLVLVFVLSLPFIQTRVEGDGIGYYAYARSLMIDHNLSFHNDWKDGIGAPVVVEGMENGRPVWGHHTQNGHLANHFAVGPAMLWAPFLVATHLAVLELDRRGWNIAADGLSRPYVVVLAVATALYGFLGLLLSFRLARKYFDERWALAATIGIWFASSLPPYMYVVPSWPHAHAAFAAALFLWYWDRTREDRSTMQWGVLGLIAGLMLDVYYANFVFLIAPIVDSFVAIREAWRGPASKWQKFAPVLRGNLLFCVAAVLAFLPTLITRQIIFGSPFRVGAYSERHWNWDHPVLWGLLFSRDRGVFLWTPILLIGIVGLFYVWRRSRTIGGVLSAIAAAFYLLISIYPWWDGVSSFGNRFFISLTPIFVLGLAGAFSEFARRWKDAQGAWRRVVAVCAILIVWNLGLVFQWSTGLLPERGPVYWNEVVYNQFRVVPAQLAQATYARVSGRHSGNQ